MVLHAGVGQGGFRPAGQQLFTFLPFAFLPFVFLTVFLPDMKYSIIVPVFNRPDEVDELLESLTCQSVKDFEVVIVEDGSKIPCREVCDKYAGRLDLHYYYKENSGRDRAATTGRSVRRATICSFSTRMSCFPGAISVLSATSWSVSLPMPSAARIVPTIRLPTRRRRFPTP